MEREKTQRKEEKELLSRHLEDQKNKAESLAQEVVDQQGENQLLKKKHLVTFKVGYKKSTYLLKKKKLT